MARYTRFSILPTFDFVYGCCLGIQLLKQTDNLSRTLQESKISAADRNAIDQDVIKTLPKNRNDSAYDFSWDYAENEESVAKITSQKEAATITQRW